MHYEFDAWPYGALSVLEALWQQLGIADLIRDHLSGRQVDFPVERALFAMVANRACAPGSKLSCYAQWLREDVRIAGTASLALQHLYRAMDLLEAQKKAIEHALYFRLADLLNLDVELIFYDTTSLHFDTDEIDQGEGAEALVEGSMAAGLKTYQPPRKRGRSKHGRSDAPQLVIGLAVTRDGLPVRHWVFPGNTVEVSTVAQGKDDLRGWKLRRCVFVGDAGMVSQENLERLSTSGGKSIICLPMRRGDEVPPEVRRPTTTWKDFIRTPRDVLVATDFFTAEGWMLSGLVTYYILFFLHLGSRKVQMAGLTPHPNEAWMVQVARNGTMEEWGFLSPGQYLIHDRDAKFCSALQQIIADAGVKRAPLPPRSLNVHAYAERGVRSVKDEALFRMILFGERSLRHVLNEYVDHDHQERLGGLLEYYERKAACVL